MRKPSLGLILILGLLHGLLYIFLVPPWQHYDEPAHFEYAWLIANRPGLPLSGEFDQPLRRALAASMIEHDFFRGMDLLPDLEASNEAVWIGVSQVGDPPLYYVLASLPLRFLSTSDVTLQLYAARFVSLGLYLLSILCAWGMLQELVSDDHILRWMVPLSLALLPGFTDLMTSVNNDVGAVVLFCLFLWGSLRLIRRGFSLPGLLWVGAAALLCLWTKETVILALPLLGLVLLLTLFRNRWRWVPWALLLTLITIIPILVFSWGDALYWIRTADSLQKIPTRVSSVQAPLGGHVLNLEVDTHGTPSAVLQLLPDDQTRSLRGRPVTLGAWVWASEPMVTNAFYLDAGHEKFSYQLIRIGTSPTFFAFSTTIADDADLVRVLLSPNGKENTERITVFYDGLVLAEGTRPLDEIPQFNDPLGRAGVWGSMPFYNLMRNASMESVGPGIRSWVEKIRPENFRAIPSPSWVFNSFIDWDWSAGYYQETTQHLLNTYWAKFGWGHVPILPFTALVYFVLQMITLVGAAGAMVRFIRRGLNQPWDLILFLGIALMGIVAQTFIRGIQALVVGEIYFPPARYAYPVIILIMLMLNAGWLEIAYFLERSVHLSPRVKLWVYALFFLGLDLASIYSIAYYYYIR